MAQRDDTTRVSPQRTGAQRIHKWIHLFTPQGVEPRLKACRSRQVKDLPKDMSKPIGPIANPYMGFAPPAEVVQSPAVTELSLSTHSLRHFAVVYQVYLNPSLPNTSWQGIWAPKTKHLLRRPFKGSKRFLTIWCIWKILEDLGYWRPAVVAVFVDASSIATPFSWYTSGNKKNKQKQSFSTWKKSSEKENVNQILPTITCQFGSRFQWFYHFSVSTFVLTCLQKVHIFPSFSNHHY